MLSRGIHAANAGEPSAQVSPTPPPSLISIPGIDEEAMPRKHARRLTDASLRPIALNIVAPIADASRRPTERQGMHGRWASPPDDEDSQEDGRLRQAMKAGWTIEESTGRASPPACWRSMYSWIVASGIARIFWARADSCSSTCKSSSVKTATLADLFGRGKIPSSQCQAHQASQLQKPVTRRYRFYLDARAWRSSR